MVTPYLGEIRAFGFSFAPRTWARCEGQLLSVAQNEALFSLLGTIYGGNGRTTFGLPDLRGRVSLNMGDGPGLTPRQIGQRSGAENVTLIERQLPQHSHTAQGSNAEANSTTPTGNTLATVATPIYASTTNAGMNGDMVGLTGGGQQHYNIQPTLAINWCIALAGVYPSRH